MSERLLVDFLVWLLSIGSFTSLQRDNKSYLFYSRDSKNIVHPWLCNRRYSVGEWFYLCHKRCRAVNVCLCERGKWKQVMWEMQLCAHLCVCVCVSLSVFILSKEKLARLVQSPQPGGSVNLSWQAALLDESDMMAIHTHTHTHTCTQALYTV